VPGGVKNCWVVDILLAYSIGAFLVVISGWLLAIATGWNAPYDVLTQGLLWLRTHPWESLILAIFLLIIGIMPFLKPRKTIDLSFRTSSKWGEIRVTVEALGDIISRSAHAVPAVRHVQPIVGQREDGLEILLNCQFNPESIIPEISDELQTRVREDVELFTGIKVAEVKVLVRRFENIQTAPPARVR
jgi:uncharacterized alkaline shock family protein YloU